MASTKEYLDFIMGQLSNLEEITYRAMMKEYILYYRGKIVGGIYDDRLLVKPVESAIHYMSKVQYELPYDGAKEMLLVEEVDNRKFLEGLFQVMYDELPNPKGRNKLWMSYSFLRNIMLENYKRMILIKYMIFVVKITYIINIDLLM